MVAAAALLGLSARAAPPEGAQPVQVGSKRFTESYLLGAIVRETLAVAGVQAEHRPGLGNTAVLERSLASGAIDVYPEYTGTIAPLASERSSTAVLPSPGRCSACTPATASVSRTMAPSR